MLADIATLPLYICDILVTVSIVRETLREFDRIYANEFIPFVHDANIRNISESWRSKRLYLFPKIVAEKFLEKFNDISLLADLMGHESIETTRIYLQRTSMEQQEIIDKIVTW